MFLQALVLCHGRRRDSIFLCPTLSPLQIAAFVSMTLPFLAR